MESFRDMLGAGRYAPAEQLVDTSAQVVDPNRRFRFEMPWPWLVDDADAASGQRSLQLVAPRSDGDAAWVWITTEMGHRPIAENQVRAESKAIARSVGGRALRPRRLLVGGVPSVDFGVELERTERRHVVIPTSEFVVEVDFQAPNPVAEGYRVHLDAMLATWVWT